MEQFVEPLRNSALPTIRNRLALIVLACVIPAVLGFAMLIAHYYQRERAQIARDTTQTARALILAVDRDLNSGKMAAFALATSPYLANNDLAAFHAQAQDLLSAEFPGFTFVLSDQFGQQVVNTMVPFGQPLPHRGSALQGHRVFETGKAVVSDLFIGGVSGRPTVAIDVPVRRNGKIVYSLAVGFLPEHLGKILAEQRLPADRTVVIFDTDGVIVARTREPEKYVGKHGSPALLERMRAINEDGMETTTPEGVSMYSIFSRSPVSGWTVEIGVPSSAVRAELLQSTIWIGAAVIALLAAGLALAWRMGGAISGSVKALAMPSPGAAEPAHMALMSFKEADEVAAELLQNRRHLERLVDERTDERDLLEQRISERTRELREALDFNEAILLQSPLPMGVYAASGECVLANQAYAELVGATREFLLAQNFHDIASWKPVGLIDDCVAALTLHRLLQRDIHVVSSFGKELWVAVRILPIQLSGKYHLLTQFFDMTERRLVEERLEATNARLAESERFSRTITDNLPGLIAYWDTQLTCRFANKQYFEWFALTPDQMLGMRLRDLVGPNLFAMNEPYLRRTLGGERLSYERSLTKTSGEVRDTWVNYIPDVDSEGKVAGIFVLVSDVTALKQAEEEQRIAATAFESHEAMMVTDANNLVLRVNRAFTDITGYSSQDIVGKTPGILKSGRHDRAFFASMWDSIDRAGVWQGEIWGRRKNGEIFPSWMTITAVKDSNGKITHYVGTQTDITLRKAAEDEIKHLAFFDALTGLPNRRLLLDRLRQTLAASSRTGREGALMFIDLDNFKALNDTLGHDKGDLLLQQVAERLIACVRDMDTIARLGGDEFVVMLEELSPSPEDAVIQAQHIGEKILMALKQPYDLAGFQHHGTTSIGVTLFGDHKNSIEELMKRADLAMYQAKAAGRNAMRFFDSEIQAVVTAHFAMNAAFRQGLLQEEFVLHYQAQVDDRRGLTGVEALVRWRHPQRGMIAPREFIPLAEETGLILPLGHWVLKTACAQLVAWAAQPNQRHLTIAVNVSAVQFRQPDYVAQVLAVLDNTGANPRQLKLEITESLLLHDVEDIILKMTALQSRGIRFSLDDFGTGYSSLAYLKRLPLDQLKIDPSFVRDVLTDHNDAVIARAIVALGQSLGLAVIAEGVETEEQRLFLANHNCHSYQGFLFGRALPLAEFEQIMKERDNPFVFQ